MIRGDRDYPEVQSIRECERSRGRKAVYVFGQCSSDKVSAPRILREVFESRCMRGFDLVRSLRRKYRLQQPVSVRERAIARDHPLGHRGDQESACTGYPDRIGGLGERSSDSNTLGVYLLGSALGDWSERGNIGVCGEWNIDIGMSRDCDD